MNNFMKYIGAAGLVLASTSASALNVGGVIWDPDYFFAGPPSSMDFDADTAYKQWFAPAADAGNIDPLNAVGLPVADGDVLQGMGEFSFINDKGTNTASSTGGGAGSFCPGCELTFVFETTVAGDNFTGGYIDIYVDNTPDFFNPNSAVIAEATDGVLWLSLNIDSINFIPDPVLGFGAGHVDALLSVVGGLAMDNFDTNEATGGADFEYSSDAIFDGLFADGTADLVGNSIPEPTSLALLGLGLLGFGARARRKAQ